MKASFNVEGQRPEPVDLPRNLAVEVESRAMDIPPLSGSSVGPAIPRTLPKQYLPQTGPSDGFEKTPPEDPAPQKPRGGKVFATVSLTGSAGMFLGAKIGASLGNPAMGFLVGTLVGGGVGLALAQFAYPKT